MVLVQPANKKKNRMTIQQIFKRFTKECDDGALYADAIDKYLNRNVGRTSLRGYNMWNDTYYGFIGLFKKASWGTYGKASEFLNNFLMMSGIPKRFKEDQRKLESIRRKWRRLVKHLHLQYNFKEGDVLYTVDGTILGRVNKINDIGVITYTINFYGVERTYTKWVFELIGELRYYDEGKLNIYYRYRNKDYGKLEGDYKEIQL